MNNIDDTNDSFAHVLEDKVVKLASNIKSLQQVVKDAETRAKNAEIRMNQIKVEIVRTENEKKKVVTTLNTLKVKFESEKETYMYKIKTYVEQIEWMRDDSRKTMESIMLDNANSVASMEMKIDGLKKELKTSQEECNEQKNIVEDLKKEVARVEENLRKEGEARENAETVAATMIAKLE